MKIAIITSGFGEPTIPFVHHLQRDNNSCDIYILSLQGRCNCGTLDFDAPIKGKKIYSLQKNNKLYNYLDKNVNIYNVPYFLERNKKYLIGFWPFLKNIKIINTLVNTVKDKSYDVVFVVTHEHIDALVCRMLKRKNVSKVLIAFHEILQSHFGIQKLSEIVNKTQYLGFPLLTFSFYNKKILEKLSNKQVETLYFGPFETYNLFDTSLRIISEDYILFIGNIQPYKGLSFLYDTISEFGNDLQLKIVVAGSGNDAVLDKIKSDDRFILINRYLKDYEFANFAKYAKCIICPYKAGSQSGITHTAMVYGTPIIATNVAAFPEFIENRANGVIIEYGNKKELFKEIMYYASSKTKSFYIPDHLKWDNIVSSFYKIIHD